jgi:hypothetical protein
VDGLLLVSLLPSCKKKKNKKTPLQLLSPHLTIESTKHLQAVRIHAGHCPTGSRPIPGSSSFIPNFHYHRFDNCKKLISSIPHRNLVAWCFPTQQRYSWLA